MAWNNRDKVAAIAIAIQSTPGVFTAPNTTTDLAAVASLTNASSPLTVADPTLTGAIWDASPIVLGQTSTLGGSIPLRGPGGSSPPALGAWPTGRLMLNAGFSEQRLAAPVSSVLQAGSTTGTLVLANTESSVDDFLLGMALTQGNIGTGFRSTSVLRDYVGATRTAILAETLGAAPATGAAYTRPAGLFYVLGTLTTAPPLLSVSIWRDKKRYDYRDCAAQSLSIDAPVANEAAQVFPSLDFSLKGIAVGEYDDTTPNTSGLLAVPVPPVRAGKFFLANTLLGHADVKVSLALTTGAASNQNQDAGQDGYDIQSGTRTVDLDLNSMAVSDLNIKALTDAQTLTPLLSTWGTVAGNKFGLVIPNLVIQPLTPGSRNGYVNLTGQAAPNDIDKSIALAIWY